jgi:hypothetical protein
VQPAPTDQQVHNASQSRAHYPSVLDPLDQAEQNQAKHLHLHLRMYAPNRVERRVRHLRERVFRGLDLLDWRNDGLFLGHRPVVGLVVLVVLVGEEVLRRGRVLVRWMADLDRLGMVMGLLGLVLELHLLLRALQVCIRNLGVVGVIRR